MLAPLHECLDCTGHMRSGVDFLLGVSCWHSESFRALSISGVPIRDTQAVQSVPKLLHPRRTEFGWWITCLFRVLDCPLVLTDSLYYVNHSGNVSLLSLFILLVRARASSVNWNICVYEYLYSLVCFDYSPSPKGLLFVVGSYVDILLLKFQHLSSNEHLLRGPFW